MRGRRNERVGVTARNEENEHAENEHAENEHAENEHAENEHAENEHAENEHAENERVNCETCNMMSQAVRGVTQAHRCEYHVRSSPVAWLTPVLPQRDTKVAVN